MKMDVREVIQYENGSERSENVGRNVGQGWFLVKVPGSMKGGELFYLVSDFLLLKTHFTSWIHL
jgi:hypothetical protein